MIALGGPPYCKSWYSCVSVQKLNITRYLFMISTLFKCTCANWNLLATWDSGNISFSMFAYCKYHKQLVKMFKVHTPAKGERTYHSI